MNFLEQLAAEYFSLAGYFVRTNVKFGRRSKGGFEGEADVLAVRMGGRDLVHLETSMDALTWRDRFSRFERKFRSASRHYAEMLGVSAEELGQTQVTRMAVASWSRSFAPASRDGDIRYVLIQDFVCAVREQVTLRHPMRDAVPEEYPLLRAIQFASAARHADAGESGLLPPLPAVRKPHRPAARRT